MLSGYPGTPKYFDARESEYIVSNPVLAISPPTTTGTPTSSIISKKLENVISISVGVNSELFATNSI